METATITENELARKYVDAMGGGTDAPRIVAAACIYWAKEQAIDVSKIDNRYLGDWIVKYRRAKVRVSRETPSLADYEMYTDF